MKVLRDLVDKGPRKPGTENHVKSRDYLLGLVKGCTHDGRLEEFTHRWSETGQDLTMWNIIGDLNWKDATVRVALLAHWDTHPTSERDNDPTKQPLPTPGANANASGVAVLVELARALNGHLPTGLGVEFVLTDGQDLGPKMDEMGLGAIAYVQGLKGGVKPDYAIVLDMVGQKNLKVRMELNSLKSAKQLEYGLYRHAAKIGLADTFPMEFGLQIYDDHVPLINSGIRSVALVDFDYLLQWHTSDDIPDRCAPESLALVGKLLESWFQQDPPFSYGL